MLFLWCVLVLVNLVSVATGTSAGVKVRLTQKGLEYGQQIEIDSIQQKLKTIKLMDMSGTEKLDIGKVEYSITGMQIVNLGLPKSAVGFVPGTGILLSVANAYITLRGNWRVKYLRLIRDTGSFDLTVNELAVSSNIEVKSDGTGHPTVSMTNCAATVGSVKVKLHGGASWLYSLFSSFMNTALHKALQKQICRSVTDSFADMNSFLKSLNAKVDQYAEIEYTMVESPVISNTMIELGFKGEFYNIGQHKEPPFSPKPFSLPSQETNMLYMGVSAFSINSASFVYHRAGALRLYITDDMIPSDSSNRLNTKTFGTFIPQIEKTYPGLMMKLLFETVKEPLITCEPNNMTIQASGMMTAFAIQSDGTLSPLFVLNLEGSVSTNIYVSGLKLAGHVTLDKIHMSLAKSYVGSFQVTSLDDIFTTVLKVAVIPKVNAQLKEGYSLPATVKMQLQKTQIQVLKDYVLIGTDVQVTA
ncbi:bactericidal permeability-increasing protein isoform X1 [Labeo rohita]|uniref:bactericidal permeability-increasing protein isoform X1 n=3 Tax=Labeo rohita TaxID=84645 RepID=UPI0021E1FB4D|nr:bactericidal permeability-increasing protein isoform X1 [Labeo rohita]